MSAGEGAAPAGRGHLLLARLQAGEPARWPTGNWQTGELARWRTGEQANWQTGKLAARGKAPSSLCAPDRLLIAVWRAPSSGARHSECLGGRQQPAWLAWGASDQPVLLRRPKQTERRLVAPSQTLGEH